VGEKLQVETETAATEPTCCLSSKIKHFALYLLHPTTSWLSLVVEFTAS
jgi:hypothetical protein